MLPVLMLVGLGGGRRRFWLPLPTVLVWPFWLLGWLAWGVSWALRAHWQGALRSALVMGAQLSGLRVDVDSADGHHFHLRLI
jgi:hypothetical protein